MPEVVNDVRLNAAAIQKYEDDATVMHVLNKLRRFQVPPSDSRYQINRWYPAKLGSGEFCSGSLCAAWFGEAA